MFDLKDVITLSLASIGAGLGGLNTWNAFRRDRRKLRVVPKHATPVGGIDPRLTFGIEVTNLGGVALTVREVGVFYHGTKNRGVVIQPFLLDGGPWPRRLDPRTSVTVYAQGDFLHDPRFRVRCAYAMTDCGLVFEGQMEEGRSN